MAKVGEADERWIVEERADGANVGGWHWQEKNAFGWSRERFNDLLSVTICEGEPGTSDERVCLPPCVRAFVCVPSCVVFRRGSAFSRRSTCHALLRCAHATPHHIPSLTVHDLIFSRVCVCPPPNTTVAVFLL
jgi:hypothetical protein